MRIIGIDPGLARVGYGLIDSNNNQNIMLDCGIIKTEKDSSEENRILEIHQDLELLLKKWRPDKAAVEKFFFYRSSTTISVVQARGVIIMTLAKMNIPIINLAPMQVKLAVTGSGKSSKNEVIQSVMSELNLDIPPKPDDAADALAIALTSLQSEI